MFDETKIDALLAAIEAAVEHNAPGETCPVIMRRSNVVRLQWDTDPVARAVAELPAAVVQYREALRRAALLTPEAVKAICEREGGYAFYAEPEAWFQCQFDGFTIGGVFRDGVIICIDGTRLRTVGQLEDAIAKAKGETNA